MPVSYTLAQSYGHHQGTVHGGWEKCLGPFDHYQAKAYGVDVWDCHYNNCYVRRDHNGGKCKCKCRPIRLLIIRRLRADA